MGNVFFSNDLIFLISGLVGLGLIGVFYFIFKSPKRTKVGTVAGDAAAQRQAPRRAVGNRNRMRGGTALGPRQGAHEVENDENADEASSSAPVDLDDPKLGAKKRAKLEAKAEKKAHREAETKMREQRKVKQEKEDAERKLQEDMERAAEEKLEEEKRMAEEAKKRKEEEEYLKMKSGFVIEEEGFDEEEEDEEGNLLQEFINHIKEKKVVMLEDLAAKFRLKIQTVISRIEELLTSGALTGVIDDRGKFIYITNDELKAVADFIKKRGRVSIQELVENSNNLISLN